MGADLTIDAIGFVREHGVVLESAKGPVPNLADAVATTRIRGNWWNRPDGKQIFLLPAWSETVSKFWCAARCAHAPQTTLGRGLTYLASVRS